MRNTVTEEDGLGPIGPYQASTDPYYRIQLPRVQDGLDTKWYPLGACRNRTDVDAFAHTKNARLAFKAVCAGCDVAARCLAFALANGEDYGIWGGLDEKERRVLVRSR